MAVVLKPPRGMLVPVGPVQIDSMHPLANGMFDCILWNNAGDPRNLSSRLSAEVTQISGPTNVMTAEGPAGYASGGSYYSSPNHGSVVAGDLTIRCRFSPIAGVGTYTTVVAKATGTREYGFYINASSPPQLRYVELGSFGADALNLGSFTLGQVHDFVIVRASGATTFYQNGVSIGTSAALNGTVAAAGPTQFAVDPTGNNNGNNQYLIFNTWLRALSADEVALLASDPYGFLVAEEMPALKAPAGAATPPFIPNSNDNFNVRQAAQRAAAALLIVTQPFVPFNTTQVAPAVANGWQHTQARTGLPANARAIPTQPTGFAVPANFTPTPKQFGWYQPLSKSAAVAQAKLGSTFVPFNTTQVSIAVVKGWYGQTSTVAIRTATAQPTQPTSFAVPPSVAPPAQTPGQFGWWANLSKSAPVAQAKPGSTFVPFNTAQVVISPQTVPLNYDAGSVQSRVVYYQSSFQVLRPIAPAVNTITGIAWHQPLGVIPPIARAQPGFTSVPLNTRQVNSIAGMGWFQPLSRSAPVAIAQTGFSFVPFNTKQIVTVQVAFDPFVKKKHVSKRRRLEDDLLRQELEIKYKRRLAIEEAFWPPTTYELPPYKLPEHVKPAPDVSDLANVIMQVQQMRAAQARQQDEEDERALLELLKREYGIEDV